MKKLKAVLFDLDGTLLDTLDDLRDAVNVALSHYGYPTRSYDEIRRFIGNGVEMLMRRSLPAGTPDTRVFEALAVFRADYEKRNRNRTAPYAGVAEMLKALRAEGLSIGVVSNKYDKAVRELCDFYFPGLVDVTVGEQAGVAKKPAPDSLLLGMDRLGVSATEAIYVGDSEVDLETARGASLPCISVLWGTRDRDALAASGGTVFASDVSALLSLLLALARGK